MLHSRMFFGDPSQFSLISPAIFALPTDSARPCSFIFEPYQLSTANDRPAQLRPLDFLRREAGLCVSRKAHLGLRRKLILLVDVSAPEVALSLWGHVHGGRNRKLPPCAASRAE